MELNDKTTLPGGLQRCSLSPLERSYRARRPGTLLESWDITSKRSFVDLVDEEAEEGSGPITRVGFELELRVDSDDKCGSGRRITNQSDIPISTRSRESATHNSLNHGCGQVIVIFPDRTLRRPSRSHRRTESYSLTGKYILSRAAWWSQRCSYQVQERNRQIRLLSNVLENEWKRRGGVNQAERFDCGRESVEREKRVRGLICSYSSEVHLQVYNLGK